MIQQETSVSGFLNRRKSFFPFMRIIITSFCFVIIVMMDGDYDDDDDDGGGSGAQIIGKSIEIIIAFQ